MPQMSFERLAELVANRDTGTTSTTGEAAPCRVVAVDGMSGSGKSTFAIRLADQLGAPIVSTDAFVPGWSGLRTSIDLLVEWILVPLARGEQARWRRYDWEAAAPGGWETVPVSTFLVIEGCGVGVPAAARLLSYLVFVDTPDHQRQRRIRRRSDWAVYAPHAEHWAEQEAALQVGAGSIERAQLVVDNSDDAQTDDPARSFTYR
jgi:hypothetical protein